VRVILTDEVDSRWGGLVRDWANVVLKAEEMPICTELGVHLVDSERIRGLNSEHRGIDTATDVLSFPLFATKEEAVSEADCLGEAEPLLLGDVVICLSVAEAQAEEESVDFTEELALLLAHGILHLVGYVHEGEDDESLKRADEMDQRQQGLVALILSGASA